MLKYCNLAIFGRLNGGCSSIAKDDIIVIPGILDVQDSFSGRLEAECDSETWPIKANGLICDIPASTVGEERRSSGVEN